MVIRAVKLRKIVSGAQTGADQAGLLVARRFGLQTGGTVPLGHKTLTGPRPDLSALYGLIESKSSSYVPRTFANVKDADATVRLAGDFGSRGEICTLNAINKYGKPYFDVDITDPPPIDDFITFLHDNQVVVLNVAGNAEQTFAGTFTRTERYLREAFFQCGLVMRIPKIDILNHYAGADDHEIVDDDPSDFIMIRRKYDGRQNNAGTLASTGADS